MSKKVIVFDFDGVVCDSTDECMVTSWNAWEKWESRKSFRKTVDEFSEDEKSIFRKVRPRVRGAGEYYILRRAFSEGINIENQEKYNKLEKDWQEYIKPFKIVFFEARDRLRKDDVNAWINLHPIFYGVIETMKTLNNQNRLYIATLKDAKSVRLILENQNLRIKRKRLYDQSQIKSKLQALDRFQKQIGCSKEDMIFIDDNVTHLVEPKDAGYSVYLTTWGENMEEYMKIAKQHKIQLLHDCTQLLRDT
jgi:phosphoglycolate phosphatase-like HAD superfamily hydrolase